MASDNLMAMEQLPWSLRASFADAWISDFFTRDTETLTKALQRSFDCGTGTGTSSDGDGFSAEMMDSLLAKPEMAPVQTPAASGGSEEVSASKQRRSLQPNGRVTKRKSRASKRATTTFITADPANFRQMVQQVTGARSCGLNGQASVAPVLKPEPQRVGNCLQHGSALPMLDTSAFFLDGAASSLIPQPPSSGVVSDGGATATGLDFESFCSFPTLESWKVM